MTLSHFGYDKTGKILDDSKLPAALITDWQDEGNTNDQSFPTYAKLLATKGESRYSWTIDFAARRAAAMDQMQPFKEKAAELREGIILLKEQLKVIKRDKRDRREIEALEKKIYTFEKDIREQDASAADIDAKVFDLKAVNPNAVAIIDSRTTMQVIESIETQAEIVKKAMNKLKLMLES
jgi:type I restriction enzyme M protein